MPSWDPEQYLQFADARSRPFADLLARVDARAPRRVVDLGCGPGNLTLTLADRWPAAALTAVDSSPEMLDRARSAGVGDLAELVLADVGEFELPQPVDVVVTNAVLQWIPGHLPLLGRWLDRLAPGGWLALQVPGNLDAPEHRAVDEIARRPPYAAVTAAAVERPRGAEPRDYLQALTRPGVTVDVWETTYLHVLSGADPVLEWLRGTGARPVLDALTAADPALADAYLADLRAALRATHPSGPEGTVMPFRRVFAAAHKLAAEPTPAPVPTPSWQRLHHVQLSCPPDGEDVAETFWVGLMGLTRVPKPDGLGPRGGAWFRAIPHLDNRPGNEVLEVHVGVERPFVPADRRAHPALLLGDTDALDALAARLRAHGHELEDDALLPGYRRFYVHDPHGNRIEVLAPLVTTPPSRSGERGDEPAMTD